MALISFCNTSTSYASYADVDMLDEDLSPQVSEWKIEGDFSNLFYPGCGSLLNREFYVKSKKPQEFIKEMKVLGYKNGDIRIHITLRQENSDLIKALCSKNLMELPQYTKTHFFSNDKNSLKGFLDVLIKENLIPALLSKHILKKIETEGPDATELEQYQIQVQKRNAYEALVIITFI